MAQRNFNNLSIEVYSSGITRIADPGDDLIYASGLNFETFYPGGLYGAASFFSARDTVRQWAVAGAQRLVLRNGQSVVYEGKIDNLDRILQQVGQGIQVTATGYWGALMMRRRWRKIWADRRISEDIWEYRTTASVPDKCFIDRNNRLKFVPKAEAWANADVVRLRYTMPTGETIKRVTLDYDFNEGGQQWELRLRDNINLVTVWSLTATGTGSRDDTLATPVVQIDLEFISGAAQTPTSDGAIYGMVSNVVVYSETGLINMVEIAKDIRAEMAELNAAEGLIDVTVSSIVPFLSQFDSMADILTNAASFGDTSFNRIAVGLRNNEQSNSPDGKPVLFAEAYPTLTDYDYAVRFDEENLVAPVSVVQNFDGIWNWIVVEYTDDRGFVKYVSPDDDANLKNTQSITDYGQREFLLSLGEATLALATTNGRRFLAAKKDPQWLVTMPVTVVGYLRSKSGDLVPTSQVQAGKRLKFENFLSDPSGTGLTLLISHTAYNDAAETVSMSFGPPLDPLFPAFAHPVGAEVVTSPSISATNGGGGNEKWWRRLGLTREQWRALSGEERKRLKREWRRSH